MPNDAPNGFETVVAELQKMKNEVNATLDRYVESIQGKSLDEHHPKRHSLCPRHDITCDADDVGCVLWERDSQWENSLRISAGSDKPEGNAGIAINNSSDDRLSFLIIADECSESESSRRLISISEDETGKEHTHQVLITAEAEDEIALRWSLLVRRMLRPWWRQSGSDSLRGPPLISLRPVWEEAGPTSSFLGISASMSVSSSRIRRMASAKQNLEAGAQIRGNSFLQTFVLHPDSRAARWIMMVGACALLYDVIAVPVVMAFAIDIEGHFYNWYLARTIFWTVDMVLSALTGYYRSVIVEMRPARTTMRYARTWFFVDFPINVADWTGIALSKSTGLYAFFRVVKYLKFLRLLRALRILKSFDSLYACMDSLTTEVMRELLKLLCIMSAIFLVNHYLACGWYALATYNKTDDSTWIRRLNLVHPSDKYMYIIAMHWTMTQFTPATNNVSPDNERERVFAFFVVVFGLVMFSSFIGSLANTVKELQKLQVAKHQEEQMIRRFIFSRQVKTRCAHAIWNFYRTYRKKSISNISLISAEVPFLEKLPKAIQVMLLEDISIPIITKHVALKEINKIEHNLLVAVCFEAATEMYWSMEQDVFHKGVRCEDMYFLNSGSVRYACNFYKSEHVLQATQIICEIAFWASWTHCGDLIAREKCHVVKLDANIFLRGLKCQSSPEVLSFLQAYAAEYQHFFIESHQCEMPFTDIVPSALAPMFNSHMTTVVDDVIYGGEGLEHRWSMAQVVNEIFS